MVSFGITLVSPINVDINVLMIRSDSTSILLDGHQSIHRDLVTHYEDSPIMGWVSIKHIPGFDHGIYNLVVFGLGIWICHQRYDIWVPQKHSIKPMAYGHQTVVNEHGDKPIDLRNLGIRTLEIGTSTYNCKTSGFGIYHSEWTQVCALFALEMMLRHVGSSMIKWQTLDPSI